MLKRYSMIGDGLSHVSFGSLSLALVMGASPLLISIPIVVVAAFLLLRITYKNQIKSDAAIAITSASALAIGVLLTSWGKGLSTDVGAYMFGSAISLNRQDVIISVALSIVVLIAYFICYIKIFSVTFDEDFAKATGINVTRYKTLLAVLCAITIVLGMRVMGAMLISSLIIFPALSAMRV